MVTLREGICGYWRINFVKPKPSDSGRRWYQYESDLLRIENHYCVKPRKYGGHRIVDTLRENRLTARGILKDLMELAWMHTQKRQLMEV
jgi:hypothetical protein